MAAHTTISKKAVFLEENLPLLTFLSHLRLLLFAWHLPEDADDTELTLSYLNNYGVEHNKASARDMLGKRIDELFPKSRESGVPEILKTVVESGHPQLLHEIAIPSPDGNRNDFFKLHLMPMPDRHVLVVAEDISERKLAENAMLESEHKFSTIFRENPLPTSLTRLENSLLIEVNQAWSDLTGYSSKEVLGKSLDDFNFLNREARQQLRQEYLAQGQIKNKELEILCRNGDVRQVLFSVVPIRLAQQAYLLNLLLDITERKKAEAEVASRKEMLEKLAEQVPGMVYQFRKFPDGRTCFPYSSPGIQAIYGFQPEVVMYDASPVFSRIHPDDLQKINDNILESAQNQTLFHCDFRVILPGKGLQWRQCHAKPTQLPDGSTLWYGMITDITREVNNFNQIKQLLDIEEENNKRMRNFTHIVSHNLRSHTANMQGIFTLLEIEHPDIMSNPYLEMLQQAANNLNTTIHNLNDVLSTRYAAHSDWETLQLKDVVTSAVQSVANLAKEAEMEVTIDIPEHLKVKAIPAYLDSIVLNMLTNAIKFRNPNSESYIKISTKEAKTNFGLFFEDNGLGIDLTRHKHSLFGMYKTFHRHTDSRGLGLFLTKSQIETLGGTIEVESEVNKGTIFKIYLPYASD